MYKNIFDNIISSLENIDAKSESSYMIMNNIKGEKISKENFIRIKEKKEHSNIAFIDGGNAEIMGGSNFSLQFIRTAGILYKENKAKERTGYEFYILIKAFEEKGNIIYKTEIFDVKGNVDINKEDLIFDSYDNTIKEGINQAKISKIGDIARRFSELATARHVCKKADIVVLDGSLKSCYSNENKYVKELIDKCKKNNCILCSIAKTSRVFTDAGKNAQSELDDISPEGTWIYKICKFDDYSSYFTKLNKCSKHIFCIETKDKKEVSFAAAELSKNSIDYVFPGYPYGLIEADRAARVENAEKEYLKTIFMSKLSKENIKKSIRSIDAHHILDNIRY